MFKNIYEVMRANEAIGHHWFKKVTMRFFKSRLSPAYPNGHVLYNGGCKEFVECREGHCQCPSYFISSEKRWNEPLRSVNPDGTLETVGEFQAYASLRQARRALHKL